MLMIAMMKMIRKMMKLNGRVKRRARKRRNLIKKKRKKKIAIQRRRRRRDNDLREFFRIQNLK